MKRRNSNIGQKKSGASGRRAIVAARCARQPALKSARRESQEQPSGSRISKSDIPLKPILEREPINDIWRNIGIPKSRDIRLLAPASLPPRKRFETPRDVEYRTRALVAALQDLEPALADAYENCTPDARCSIPGCPRCGRRRRGYLFSETKRVHDLPLAGPRLFVTVFLGDIPQGKLHQVQLATVHRRFRKRLERAGIGGVMIGGTEFAWDAKRRVWILHLHILSIGVERAAWDALAAGMGGADRAIPIKVERLKDTVGPLSYMQKWVTYFRPRRRLGHKLSKAVPLKPRQIAELCRCWACHRFEDFMFLYGAKRRGGRIVPIGPLEPVGPVGNSGLTVVRTITVESIYRGQPIRVTVRDEISLGDQTLEPADRASRHSVSRAHHTVPTKPTAHRPYDRRDGGGA